MGFDAIALGEPSIGQGFGEETKCITIAFPGDVSVYGDVLDDGKLHNTMCEMPRVQLSKVGEMYIPDIEVNLKQYVNETLDNLANRKVRGNGDEFMLLMKILKSPIDANDFHLIHRSVIENLQPVPYKILLALASNSHIQTGEFDDLIKKNSRAVIDRILIDERLCRFG